MGRPAGPRTAEGKSVARVERARRQRRAGGKFASGASVEPAPPSGDGDGRPAAPPAAPIEPARVVYPPAGGGAPAPPSGDVDEPAAGDDDGLAAPPSGGGAATPAANDATAPPGEPQPAPAAPTPQSPQGADTTPRRLGFLDGLVAPAGIDRG